MTKYRVDLMPFLFRTVEALLRVLAVCIFGGTQWLLTLLIGAVLTPEFHALKDVLNTVTAVAFAILYVIAMLDMVMIFFPKRLFGTLSNTTSSVDEQRR
jgi:hypothetical protein